MTRKTPAEIPDELLRGRRLGRRPTKAEIEAACDQLRRLGPDGQKVAVWVIRRLANENDAE